VRNSTAAAAAAVIISLLDLELAKKNREIKTIGKIDTRPQSTKMAAREGVYHLSRVTSPSTPSRMRESLSLLFVALLDIVSDALRQSHP
jgi:hypothetical protein